MNCLDAHLAQIVCDKDAVVGWCIVLVEMHTEQIWRVLASSDGISSGTPLKPQHSNPNHNPNPLVNQLWCSDFLTPPTPLIIPHRLAASLNLLFHSETDARFMQDALKGVWSISYVSVVFFPNLKQNFIAYRSSKVSDCILLHIVHLKCQIAFVKFPSCDNQALVGYIPKTCCSCLFEPEIMKISQSTHKMYSNNILNFQESTTNLNTCTKKSRNLLNAPRICSLKTAIEEVWKRFSKNLFWRHANHFECMLIK